MGRNRSSEFRKLGLNKRSKNQKLYILNIIRKRTFHSSTGSFHVFGFGVDIQFNRILEVLSPQPLPTQRMYFLHHNGQNKKYQPDQGFESQTIPPVWPTGSLCFAAWWKLLSWPRFALCENQAVGAVGLKNEKQHLYIGLVCFLL